MATVESPDTESGNGADTRPAATLPPIRRTPSMRPALVVLGIAMFIVVVFGVTAVVTGSAPAPRVPSSNPQAVAGTTLRAVPALGALAPIIETGSPPANIVDSLTIPLGTRALAPTNNAGGDGQYDQQMSFTVPASQAAVIAFFRSELGRAGWHVISSGPAYGQSGIEVLAKKGGTDGWEWEAGAVVSATTFAGDTEHTPFVLRLFQVPDAN